MRQMYLHVGQKEEKRGKLKQMLQGLTGYDKHFGQKS